ncbi:MAG: hypothetical protein IKG18_07000 [Atopobiaceae bacterium]|nr:hypothetical protein [Atopobiaceae bacterium]
MSDKPILTTYDMEPSVEIMAYECKFTVTASEGLGGAIKNTEVTFEGYASGELFAAIVDAIGKVVGA